MGEPIPILVEPVDVADKVSAEEEIDWDVRHINPNRAGVPSGIRADHLKSWIAEARAEENPDPSRWRIVVEIIQLASCTGELASDFM